MRIVLKKNPPQRMVMASMILTSKPPQRRVELLQRIVVTEKIMKSLTPQRMPVVVARTILKLMIPQRKVAMRTIPKPMPQSMMTIQKSTLPQKMYGTATPSRMLHTGSASVPSNFHTFSSSSTWKNQMHQVITRTGTCLFLSFLFFFFLLDPGIFLWKDFR